MKLTLDEIRVVRRMRERGAAVTHLAKDLGVTEGAVRYRLKRLEGGGTGWMAGRARRRRWTGMRRRWKRSRSGWETGGFVGRVVLARFV